MFTTRQIASKVNTAFVSLSVVCIMLFFSLTVFSTGMGLARAFSGNVEEGTLYDATLTANVYLNAGGIHDEEALASMSEEDREYQRVADEKAAAIAADAEAYDWDIAAKLADASPTWDALVDRSVQVDVYVDADESYGAIMDRYGKDTGNDKQTRRCTAGHLAGRGLAVQCACRADGSAHGGRGRGRLRREQHRVEQATDDHTQTIFEKVYNTYNPADNRHILKCFGNLSESLAQFAVHFLGTFAECDQAIIRPADTAGGNLLQSVPHILHTGLQTGGSIREGLPGTVSRSCKAFISHSRHRH